MMNCVVRRCRRRACLKTCVLGVLLLGVVNIAVLWLFANPPPETVSKRIIKYAKQCPWFDLQKLNDVDVSMERLYELLSFEHQEFSLEKLNLTYNPRKWNYRKKLHVIVVPAIQIDSDSTHDEINNVLNTIVQALDEKPTRTFIWAEISYLSLWWAQANETMRARMRNLIVNTKQLEIVTGGWVMTDEANSFYYAMIEQMIEGHEWLRANVDASVRPRYGWSIDPFGYTPTMAYLLKRMGFHGMLIQRVHSQVRRYLIENRRSTLYWRQSWAPDLVAKPGKSSSEIFCQVTLPDSFFPMDKCWSSKCTENGLPKFSIGSPEYLEFAKKQLDIYRQLSQLIGKENHDVLLEPVFLKSNHSTVESIRNMIRHYESSMEFMSSKKKWSIDLRFGTLKDYFEQAKKNVADQVDTFSGDFFTYADRGVEYWSGYYTSRPYYKRLDRLVEYYLRSAEILFSYMNVLQSLQSNKKRSYEPLVNELFQHLLVARKNIGAIHDYDVQPRLVQSLTNCKKVIEQSAAYLMLKDLEGGIPENIFSIDDIHLNSSVLIDLSSSGQEQTVVIFNPSSNERNEIVSLKVNCPNLEVYDGEGVQISDYHISLVWNEKDKRRYRVDLSDLFFPIASPDKFELIFRLQLPRLSFKTIILRPTRRVSPHKIFSDVQFFVKRENLEKFRSKLFPRTQPLLFGSSPHSSIKLSTIEKESIELELDFERTATFSLKTGTLTTLSKRGSVFNSRISFIKFNANKTVEIEYSKLLKWVRIEHSGSIRKRVCSHLTVLIHCVDFFPSLDRANQLELPSVRIWNLVDLRRGANDELAMRVTSDIRNERIFYTDLNGFQYIKRKTYLDKLPIQGNVYPMPSGAFIQDDKMRMNLLSGQALGVASLKSSSLEVFFGRTADSYAPPELFTFSLLFEPINQNIDSKFRVYSKLEFPSLFVQIVAFDLANPLLKLVLSSRLDLRPRNELLLLNQRLTKELPCDLRVLSIRTMQTDSDKPHRNEFGLILHRLVFDDCLPDSSMVVLPRPFQSRCHQLAQDNYQIEFSSLFELFISNLRGDLSIELTRTDLSMSPYSNGSKVDPNEFVYNVLRPLELEAFRVSFTFQPILA